MTTSDWIIDLVLIALVVLQLRERRLSIIQVLLPIALVSWATITYVKAIPTDGNNVLLLGLAIVIGAGIGAGVGVLTRVRIKDRNVVVRATAAAAILWVVGMGVRLVFQIWATNGGGQSIGQFDFTNNLSNDVWAPALVFMAGVTVLVRSAILWTRVLRTGSGLRQGNRAAAEMTL